MSKCLNPFERNELEKAMLGRGVDYKTIQLILMDFDARIEHLENLGSSKVCPICGKIAGFNSHFQAYYCTSCGNLWRE